MQPVFTAAEMRALDARAIQQLGIPGPQLMEHAGIGAARWIAREWGPLRRKSIVIVCGKGNNGGDGFVVARRLRAAGAAVRVLLVGRRMDVKGDAAQALARWRGRVEEIVAVPALPALGRALGEAHGIVDALLGTGVTGAPHGLTGEAIQAINAAGRPVVSLDVPSGLDSDRGLVPGLTVRATLTTTFAAYKRGLLLYPGAAHAGRVEVVDIGIPPAEVARGISTFLLDASDIRAHFPPRRADTHKGSYGHLVVVAGSVGKSGAAGLTGRAALRSGVGLCTIGTPASQQPIVASFGMEHMTEPLPETAGQALSLEARERILELAARVEAVALGPGLSLDPETQALARALVTEVKQPMVVDADALSALAGHLELLPPAPAPRVLTPHPGEMARMLGRTVREVESDRPETVRDVCVRYRVHLALKGARTVIGSPDGRVWINPTGNPAMASGGSGDVLTGMVGAFLARGLDALTAVQAGCLLHGLAGDLARAEQGEEGLIASDIIAHIPAALRALRAGAAA